jgi:hypothetical protein
MVIRPTCDEEQVSCLFSIFLLFYTFISLWEHGKAQSAEGRATQNTADSSHGVLKKQEGKARRVFIIIFVKQYFGCIIAVKSLLDL